MTDPFLPSVFTHDQAVDAGLTAAQVARRVATGRWRRLRRGIYCHNDAGGQAGADEQHRLLVQAALLAHQQARPAAHAQLSAAEWSTDLLPDRITVASHASAACLYGWPRPWAGWGAPQLTAQADTNATRRRADVVIHSATLTREDVAIRDGVLVTSPGRTIADLLRRIATPAAVALADHALRRGHATYDDVTRALSAQAGWPHVVKARRALCLIDPRRESWLESWSCVALHSVGIALPVPQVMILDAESRFVARVDAFWPDHALVGEADGAVKYDLEGPYARPSGPAAEDLIAWGQRRLDDQRRRHERLMDLGLHVVRWTASDVTRDLHALARRISERQDSGRPARFRGRAVAPPQLPWTTESAPYPLRLSS
jgi:hypothetical protein